MCLVIFLGGRLFDKPPVVRWRQRGQQAADRRVGTRRSCSVSVLTLGLWNQFVKSRHFKLWSRFCLTCVTSTVFFHPMSLIKQKSLPPVPNDSVSDGAVSVLSLSGLFST